MLSPSISLSDSPFQTSSNKDHMSGLSGLSIKVCQSSVWQHCHCRQQSTHQQSASTLPLGRCDGVGPAWTQSLKSHTISYWKENILSDEYLLIIIYPKIICMLQNLVTAYLLNGWWDSNKWYLYWKLFALSLQWCNQFLLLFSFEELSSFSDGKNIHRANLQPIYMLKW